MCYLDPPFSIYIINVDHKCITPVLGVQPGLTYLKQTVHHWEETNQTDKNLDFVPIGMLKRMSLLLNWKLKHLNTCLKKKKCSTLLTPFMLPCTKY